MSPENDLFKYGLTRENYYYYYGLFYSKLIKDDKIRNFTIFKGNIINWDNFAFDTNPKLFLGYSPELFYLMNRILIKWTQINYNETNYFIFINA